MLLTLLGSGLNSPFLRLFSGSFYSYLQPNLAQGSWSVCLQFIQHPFLGVAHAFAQLHNGLVCVLAVQLCPTVCDPMDCSRPGSSVHGILQARILEWVAIPFSTESFWSRNRTEVSCIAGRFFIVWATREAHRMGLLPITSIGGPCRR